jgi:hypothetical protein
MIDVQLTDRFLVVETGSLQPPSLARRALAHVR